MGKIERTEKYWICDACAEKKKYVAWKTGNTLIMGLCGWCDSREESFLTPVEDFRKPKEAADE